MNVNEIINENDFESHVIHNSGDLELANKLEKIAKPQGTIYRGIYYNINDLKVGEIYTHWYETVSWSKSLEVAKNFALKWSNVSEGHYELLYEERYGENISWHKIPNEIFEDMKKEFVQIVLINHEGIGVYANDYIALSDGFSDEEEVIVVTKNWIISNIDYDENNDLYLVTVR